MISRYVFVCCCLFLASGCALQHPQRAKPADGTELKATQKPYTVMGRRYEPIPSHVGFVQRGVASWYGRDFHGRNTSNGERYDMYAMTAAHKTLPLGVYVKVVNTGNGREVIVRVNDRGPFVKDRIIDLSYAAARKLGIDADGTGPVKVEALGYRKDGSDRYAAAENYDTGSYTVQIGSFKDLKNARRLAEDMKSRYGFSEVRMIDVYGESFHRVYAGKYSSLPEAETAEQVFSEQGYPGSFAVALE